MISRPGGRNEEQMKSTAKVVSIILPCRNADPVLLGRAVDSVLAQTFAEYELLILDDGSDEDFQESLSAEAAKDGRIRLIRQEPSGVSAARNRGIREAEGEYITLLDADDTVSAWFLEEAVEAAKIPEQLAMIFKELLFLHGGIALLEDMQKRVLSRRCWNALENLREIYELAKAYGVEQYLSFDLGLTRSLDYYTGMLFEGYAAGMGYSLIGGGRYDNMMQRFGKPCPATGFALGIDRIALTLERQGKQFAKEQETVLVAYGKGKAADGIRTACILRKEGKRVKLADRAMTEAELRQAMQENRCDALQYIGS